MLSNLVDIQENVGFLEDKNNARKYRLCLPNSWIRPLLVLKSSLEAVSTFDLF
jgi:hypothetical protein